MRTLMLIGSIAMAGTGIFCLANGSAAFLSVAFVIGLIFVLMGVLEFSIGRRSDYNISGNDVNISADGAIMAIWGAVILAGQITDDTTALTAFALWALIEAILSLEKMSVGSEGLTRDVTFESAIVIVMLLLGLYMFFDSRLLNIKTIMLIGALLVLLGLKRFLLSFNIEYDRPGFMTGNEERLAEAKAEEKRALAKAKEGIREQKLAQKRIANIMKDMAKEKAVIDDAVARKQLAERDAEKK